MNFEITAEKNILCSHNIYRFHGSFTDVELEAARAEMDNLDRLVLQESINTNSQYLMALFLIYQSMERKQIKMGQKHD